MTAAVGGHRYATATAAAVGTALLGVSLAGSAYVITGLVRRGVTAGLHWSAGQPARRLQATAALLAVVIALAAFWTTNGQLRGW